MVAVVADDLGRRGVVGGSRGPQDVLRQDAGGEGKPADGPGPGGDGEAELVEGTVDEGTVVGTVGIVMLLMACSSVSSCMKIN